MRGGLLLNRDGGRQALNYIHIGLVHQLQKLARVGRQALHIPALALGIQRVKRVRAPRMLMVCSCKACARYLPSGDEFKVWAS